MESAPEILKLFVQALSTFAMSLDRRSNVPWPLTIAVLFVPVVVALDVSVWYLRGITFPISCGYCTVRPKGRCSRLTFGEWHKCWYHRTWRFRRTDRHMVDPTRRRWEACPHESIGGVAGRGFLSVNSHRDTLLYHQGFARWPSDVFAMRATVFSDYRARAASRWAVVRSLGVRGLLSRADRAIPPQILASDVLPSVIIATRATLGAVALGLIMIGISLVVLPAIGVMFEYCATYLFLVALAVAHAGIWRADTKWISRALQEAGKWIVAFTGLATLGGLVGLYAADVKDVLKTIAQVIFNAFVFSFLVYLLYMYTSREGGSRRKRRTRNRTRRRKRR